MTCRFRLLRPLPTSSNTYPKFTALGITEREKRLRWTEVVIGRPVESANDLSYREAGALLEALTEEARERSRSSADAR